MAKGRSRVFIGVAGDGKSGKTSFINACHAGEPISPLGQPVRNTTTAGSHVGRTEVTVSLDDTLITLVEGESTGGRLWDEVQDFAKLQRYVNQTYQGHIDAFIVTHRMPSSFPCFTQESHSTLKEILRSDSLKGVGIITTMHGDMDTDQREERFKVLSESSYYYKDTVEAGATMLRYENDPTQAIDILQKVLRDLQRSRSRTHRQRPAVPTTPMIPDIEEPVDTPSETYNQATAKLDLGEPQDAKLQNLEERFQSLLEIVQELDVRLGLSLERNDELAKENRNLKWVVDWLEKKVEGQDTMVQIMIDQELQARDSLKSELNEKIGKLADELEEYRGETEGQEQRIGELETLMDDRSQPAYQYWAEGLAEQRKFSG
ncbi:hypothetical protein EIP91_009720 [Steccherinum ochraceum]|uniref:G domain-containing protein n=1 Tax=Steccherinum ochraceum TaxID=92696 RepID=A0A4R0R1B5_9APHY|nr:hypothetical protein EIP91_009720 [Steccherinum ochraceum]